MRPVLLCFASFFILAITIVGPEPPLDMTDDAATFDVLVDMEIIDLKPYTLAEAEIESLALKPDFAPPTGVSRFEYEPLAGRHTMLTRSILLAHGELPGWYTHGIDTEVAARSGRSRT